MSTIDSIFSLKRCSVLALLFLVACSGGDGGCGGDGCASTPYPEGAPTVTNAVQARVSENGFNFIEDNADTLIGQFLEEGLAFCVPEGNSGVNICYERTCSSGERGCDLSLEIESVRIDAVEPSSVQATIVLGGLDQEEDYLEARLLSDCLVRLGTVDSDDDGIGDGVEASIVADFVTDPVTGDITVDLDPNNISINFDQFDIDIDGAEFVDTFLCESVDFLSELGFVRDLLFAAIQGELGGLINELTGDLLCQPCETNTDCPNGTACGDLEGSQVCINPSTEACVPAPLGIEGVFDLGSALASVTPGIEAELAYTIKAHNLAQASNGGLLLGLKGGAYAEKAACVPFVPAPSIGEVPPAASLQVNNTPQGDPFHLGIGISKAFLDEGLWAAFNSGALCLSVGSSTSDFISTGTFSALFPSLRDLAGPQSAPMILEFAPALPPTMRIGAGTVDPNTGDLIDPLLSLVWNDLDIHFHAFMNERYVRIMTYNVDLDVPIGLSPTEEGIIPVIGDLSNAFVRVETRDSELLTEDPAFLDGVLPSLIASALPLLGDSLTSPIELPEIQGFELVLNPNSFQGIENNTMLGLFANLALAPPEGDQGARTPRLQTHVELGNIQLPPTHLTQRSQDLPESERVARLMDARPRVTLHVYATLMNIALEEGEYEYSYRLNKGLWSTFRANSTLVLDDPIFLLQGTHTVELRARRTGLFASTDLEPATVQIPLDFEPPTLSLDLSNIDTLTFQAHDVVTPHGDLVFSHRVGEQGTWSPWNTTPDLNLKTLRAQGLSSAQVSVRVRDASGHITEETTTLDLTTRTQSIHGQVQQAEDNESDCSCSQTPAAPASLPLASLFLVFGLIGAARLRSTKRSDRSKTSRMMVLKSRIIPFLSLFALFGLTSACDDEEGAKAAIGQSSPCPEGCAEGEICNADGTCSPDPAAACSVDNPCPDTQACVDGTCQDHECATSADCPEAEACTPDTNGLRICGPVACNEDSVCGDVNCAPRGSNCDGSVCVCEPFCADGCSEGSFCCQNDNSCQPLPDPCGETECDPGFRPEAASASTADEASCVATPGSCNCVEMDPIPEGDAGFYSDSTFLGAQKQVVVSAWNRTYGDLVVGLVQPDDTVAWQFVDGLPESGPVSGALDGPRGGVRVAGDNVGQFSSIAADNDGKLHVAYHDVTHSNLKYAIGTPDPDNGWSWTTYILDENGETGYWSDLSINADGNPVLAYMTKAAPDPDPTVTRGTAVLRWAVASSSTPSSAEDWTWENLDSYDFDYYCNGGCSSGQKCRTDINTCERSTAASQCNDSCASGTEACFDGVCAPLAPAAPAIQSLPVGTGLFVRSARFSDGSYALVYYDSVGADLRYTRQENGVWTRPVILAGRAEDGTDTTDAGRFASIAIDNNDNVHIAYVDAVTDDLRYINLTEGTDELVDDGVRTNGGLSVGMVGQDSSIAFSASGEPRIVYQDSTRHHLLLSERGLDGTWTLITVAGGGDTYRGAFGFYARQLWDGSQSIITSFRYNRRVEPAANGVVIHRY